MKPKSGKKIFIPKKSKIALVCSGGAAKAGAFHVGVALALREKGFRFLGGLKDQDTNNRADSAESPNSDTLKLADNSGRTISIYVGSSAGSILSAYLASGFTLDEIFDSFLNGSKSKNLKPLSYYQLFSLRKDKGILSTFANLAGGDYESPLKSFIANLARESYESIFQKRWLKFSGIFSTAGIEKYLREQVLPSNDFERYKADLFIVGTQLNHSRKVVFGRYDYKSIAEDRSCLYMNDVPVSQAAAASTALPPIFAPWPIKKENGKTTYYFDGEIRDTLSTHVAFDGGADLIIASYTHQPYHFHKDIGSLHLYGMPTIVIQALYLMIERKIQQHRQTIDRNRITYDTISDYFKEHDLPETHRKHCLEALELKLSFKRSVDYVFIHPKARDHEMFFGDHFNLSTSALKETVRLGFKSAIDVLRRYEFE